MDKGGWSIFPYGAPAADYGDPIFAAALRGNGKDAWFGYPSDEKMEAMRNAWMDSNDEAASKRLDAEIQLRAFETVPIPFPSANTSRHRLAQQPQWLAEGSRAGVMEHRTRLKSAPPTTGGRVTVPAVASELPESINGDVSLVTPIGLTAP